MTSDTSAVLYQLSYQAKWELATLRVRNIPVEGEEYKWTLEVASSQLGHGFELCKALLDHWELALYKYCILLLL